MKILLSVGEGLGNVIQVLPLAKAIHRNGHDLHILNLSYVCDEDVSWLFSRYATVCNHTDIFHDFDGRIELATTKGNLMLSDRWAIPLLNNPQKQFVYSKTVNEVFTYTSIAEELGMELPDEPYSVEVGEIPNIDSTYNFCIHNGCSRANPKQWERKKYIHFDELAQMLQEIGQVTTIGAADEYIGGDNNTGLSLKDTAAVIKNSSVFISNDTGTYHLASAMQKRAVVIFTATSVYKNRHPVFHRNTNVVVKGLDCQPCQYGKEWGLCSSMSYNKLACRDIDPKIILEVIINAYKHEMD